MMPNKTVLSCNISDDLIGLRVALATDETTTRSDFLKIPDKITFEMTMELTEEWRKWLEESWTIYYVASAYAIKGKTCKLPGCDFYIIHTDDVEVLTQRAKEHGYRFVPMAQEKFDREMEKTMAKAMRAVGK